MTSVIAPGPAASVDPPEVGFVGLGTMGEPMAANLARAGTRLTVWNRSDPAAQRLAALGATVATSPHDLVIRSDVVLVMLADDTVLDAVLGRGTDRFASLAGRTLVQMGTTAPDHSAGLERDVRAVGGRYVEAPMSGSRLPAEAGELVSMVAGSKESVALVERLLAPLCSRVVRCGAVPRAMTTKLAVNHFLITMVATLAETTHLAESVDLDLPTFRAVLDSGPMASAVSRAKVAKLATRDLTAHSPVDGVHWIADLIDGMATGAGVATPFLELSASLLAEAEASGRGHQDMAAVVTALEARTRSARPRHPARVWFATASAGFRALVGQLPDDGLDEPALGSWTVRHLLGHTTRAYRTLETYLDADASMQGHRLDGPRDYYTRARALADPEAVAARGVVAGAELGPEPRAAALAIAARVEELVAQAPDHLDVHTPFGSMRLVDYLPTRAFELTVHGADLARATRTPLPSELVTASRDAARLCVEIAEAESLATVVASLTGRPTQPIRSVL